MLSLILFILVVVLLIRQHAVALILNRYNQRDRFDRQLDNSEPTKQSGEETVE